MATPNDLQAQISAVQWTNGKGLIAGSTLLGLFSVITAILASMGTFGPAGFVPNIPNGTVTQAMLAPGAGGSAASVPQRVSAATGAISTSASDFLVCLNGPTEVDLETSPAAGTTHVLKDCRASAGAPIVVKPGGSDTIDRNTSYAMTVPAQSITLTYTSLGWSIY